jgi:hypothetical protein
VRVTILGACLLAVLLVVAGLTVLNRNRARLQPGPQRHDDRAQRIRKQRRAQSRHDRRKR